MRVVLAATQLIILTVHLSTRCCSHLIERVVLLFDFCVWHHAYGACFEDVISRVGINVFKHEILFLLRPILDNVYKLTSFSSGVLELK